MIRLFVSDSLGVGKRLTLSPPHHHYLQHVMRRKAGDDLLLFNGRDGEWEATIEVLDKKQACCQLKVQTRPQITDKRLILCPAVIKKEPMDFVFQKATELGVSDIYPLVTERTVISRLNSDRAKSLLIEAAEQSERLTVPTLHPVQSLEAALTKLPKEISPVCLAERGQTTAPLSGDKMYAFFVGPEGGWTPSELDLFAKSGASFWHLGNTILRAETASVAALSCAQFCLSI